MRLKSTALLTLSIIGCLSFPAMAEKKLTVLPFEVLSIRPEVKNLGKSVSENIIDALGNIPALNMTSPDLSSKVINDLGFKVNNLADDKNAVKVGKYLETEMVLPGTIEFNNGKYQINVKLIDIKTGKSLKQIQLVSKDINELQNKIALEIINYQKIKMTNIQKERIEKQLKATKSIKAMDYYNQGVDMMQKYTGQNYDQAITLFDKALSEDKNYFLARTAKVKAKALWSYEQKQLEMNSYNSLVAETEEIINNYLRDNTGNSDIYKSLSLLAYIHNDSEKGKTYAKKVIEINPHDPEAHVLNWLNNGRKLEDKSLSNSIKLNSASIFPHIEMGGLYQRIGKTDNSISEYQEVLKISPDNIITNYNLAQIYLKTGRLDESLVKFINVVKYAPEAGPAHEGIGMAYRLQDRLSDAVNAYKNSIKFKPNDPDTHLELGNIYTEQGELDLSVNEYKEVIRLKPDNYKAHYYLGTVYKLQDKSEEAINEYKESIRLNDNFAEAHYNLGIALKKVNKLEEAINEYKKAIKISPAFAEAHLNLGSAYFDQNKLNEAISEYKEAIKSKPNYPRAFNNIGSVYQKQGKYDQAINEYKQAIKLDPKYGSAYYNLSEVYKSQKKTKEALAEIKKACESGYQPACLDK